MITSQQLGRPPLEPAVVVLSARLLFGKKKTTFGELSVTPLSRTSNALILICAPRLSPGSRGGGSNEVLQRRAHFILCERGPTWQPERHGATAARRGEDPHCRRRPLGLNHQPGEEGGREREEEERESRSLFSMQRASRFKASPHRRGNHSVRLTGVAKAIRQRA